MILYQETMESSKSFSIKAEQLLLKGLREGDKNKVKDWYTIFFPYLMAITLKKVSNFTDVEEIVQETFINSLRQLPLFRGESRLKTWMVSILRHEIADYYRKKYAKKALKTIPLFDEILQNPLKSSQEISEMVQITLGKMKKETRELLLLKYVDKKRVKEIASLFGKTVKSVESDLFRARVEFRKIYEEAPVLVKGS
ncbi:MAG: RNA polymerase sigma factor [Candidatus Pacebacteria bacterium]|jgi:RNA polymerase sigma-70 factor, ECF subfamily|nr:RNA polymerase sigma factor [Candidatus Paceibacterota bacterium]MBT6921283.1 RNA polymerase sigma factor [Candidatus Paceibacterota bacterium]